MELITSQSPLQSAHTHKHILLMIIHERNTNYKTSTWQLFTLIIRGHNNANNEDRRASKWPEGSKSNDAAEIITKETGISPSSSSETEVQMDKNDWNVTNLKSNKQQAMCLRCQRRKSDLNFTYKAENVRLSVQN